MQLKELATELKINSEQQIVGIVLDCLAPEHPALENEALGFNYDLDDELALLVLQANEHLKNNAKGVLKNQIAQEQQQSAMPALKGTADRMEQVLRDTDNLEVDIEIRLAHSAIKRGILLGLSEAQLHQQAYLTARANANAQFVKKMEKLDAEIMRSTLESRTGGLLEEILEDFDLRSTTEAAAPQGEFSSDNELDDLMKEFFPSLY